MKGHVSVLDLPMRPLSDNFLVQVPPQDNALPEYIRIPTAVSLCVIPKLRH